MSQNSLNIARAGTTGTVLVLLLILPSLVNGQDIFTSRPVIHDGTIVPPKLIYMPEPEFPVKALKEHRSGVVEVSMVVDETGSPTDVKVTKSLSPDFDAKALDAVRRYRFEPALKNGKPVSKVVQISVDFHTY